MNANIFIHSWLVCSKIDPRFGCNNLDNRLCLLFLSSFMVSRLNAFAVLTAHMSCCLGTYTCMLGQQLIHGVVVVFACVLDCV